MKLVEAQLASIVYESTSSGDITARTILPVSVPNDYVRALDVSDLSPEERERMRELLGQYKAYLSSLYSSAFKFEDWVEHTTGSTVTPTWRTFKIAGIKDK